ncbi:MAG: M48 family metallopeptidase [bacterium]
MKKTSFPNILFLLIISLIICLPVQASSEKDRNPSSESKTDEEKEESKTSKALIEKFGLCEDEKINAKLDRVTLKLLETLSEEEKEKEFEFTILDDDMVNAFALPDGKMFFFRGLIELTKTDDQLAGVVGHEMTHVIHKHSSDIAEEMLPWMIGGIVAAIVTNEPGAAVAGEMFAQAHAEKYGRKAEEDADKFGLNLMIRSGYDPIGMLQFFSFMIEEEKRNPILYKNYFLVHPYATERVETMKIILRSRGYDVPDSLYRSYLESAIEIREENGLKLIDIQFGGDVIFTIVGKNKDALELRATQITKTLDELVNLGAGRFDFRIINDMDRSWIGAKGRIFYEPENLDIEKSGLNREEYLDKILKKIRRLLWEERVKNRI